MGRPILDSVMRPVVIVFLRSSRSLPRFLHAAIFRCPDFFFLQTAMESLDGSFLPG